MTPGDVGGRIPRTLLEQLIWERRQTLDEFTEYTEIFARDHGEQGTLSRRHLDRLVAGTRHDGKPVGRPRQPTIRLLERIFGIPITELLSRPVIFKEDDGGDLRLRELLRTSARIDDSVLVLLQDQLSATRRLDRQLGAIIAYDEVIAKIRQVDRLLGHSLTPSRRERLAAMLSELRALAGWQALDMGKVFDSWEHYEKGKAAARESGDIAFLAHVTAEQAFVLIDIGETRNAVELVGSARKLVAQREGSPLRSWLAAAAGEALAADGQGLASLRAFDQASLLLPSRTIVADGPYVMLDAVHLARWRGHALARFDARGAVDVLGAALGQLDHTFVRAEAGLRVDLAIALLAHDELAQAEIHVAEASGLADQIGSVRQKRRLEVWAKRKQARASEA
jgi:hypothetical protein